MDRFNKIKSFFIKTSNKKKYNISSWEDMLKNFGEKGAQSKKIWEEYVLKSNGHRNNSSSSFIKAYYNMDQPTDVKIKEEEVRVIDKIKKIISVPSVKKDTPDKPANSNGLFGGTSPQWIVNEKGHGYNVGPIHHTSRPGREKKGWQSDNAWDALAPVGTSVFSITNGIVSYVREAVGNGRNIYGTHVYISGDSGYPDVFYTHLDGVTLNKGDGISVGDYIGVVAQPKLKSIPSHAHIGLQDGWQISSLINQDGSFKKT